MQPKRVGFIVFLFLFLPNTYILGLDFIENAHFNQDGSGQFSIKVDLKNKSKWIWLIKFLNKNYKHEGITKSIGYNAFGKAKEKLKKIADITQVDVKYDEKELTSELMFNFNTIKALNKAMRKINKGLDPPKITYFSVDDELFVRQDINGIAKKILSYQEYDNCLVKSLGLASFFKKMTYSTTYTFYKEVENYSNPLSALTNDRKSISITHHVFVPDEVEHSIGNRIHFVKK